MPGQPTITLLTDFGTEDGYVGAMKGVILSITPQARLVDISHAIPPQGVLQAALALYGAARFFPAGTVHLVVVDPGVGTPRRPLALRAGGMLFVGPDNGVFTLVLRQGPPEAAVAIENPDYYRPGGAISHTFHGRDIFAPAAAHLAAGVQLTRLGPAVRNWVELPLPTISLREPDRVVGEVLYLDHFGNAVTNIGVLEARGTGFRLKALFPADPGRLTLDGPLAIECHRWAGSLRQAYGEVDPGQPLALVGGNGLLEIAVRNGNAGAVLGIRPGDQVVVQARIETEN